MIVPLTQGRYAEIDDLDAQLANSHKWHAIYIKSNQSNRWYAGTWVDDKRVYLHRYLMEPEKGQQVDHKNGNGLDCRRGNMRLCTNQQNSWNARKHGCKCHSDLKGVTYMKSGKRRKRWIAQIYADGVHRNLGYFLTEQEAHEAYKEAAIKHFGEFARWV